MLAAPPKPPTGAEPPAASVGSAIYSCDCLGFRENNPVHFCLRCLTVWVEGLPGMFSGKRLDREMRKAASILVRRLKEDPALGRVTLNRALQAAEGPRRN